MCGAQRSTSGDVFTLYFETGSLTEPGTADSSGLAGQPRTLFAPPSPLGTQHSDSRGPKLEFLNSCVCVKERGKKRRRGRRDRQTDISMLLVFQPSLAFSFSCVSFQLLTSAKSWRQSFLKG